MNEGAAWGAIFPFVLVGLAACVGWLFHKNRLQRLEALGRAHEDERRQHQERLRSIRYHVEEMAQVIQRIEELSDSAERSLWAVVNQPAPSDVKDQDGKAVFVAWNALDLAMDNFLKAKKLIDGLVSLSNEADTERIGTAAQQRRQSRSAFLAQAAMREMA